MTFAHLHVHTDYSLLDGACKVKSLVQEVKKLGMEAIAVTDHGNMFAAIELYKAAKAENIKPIIGMESYIAPNSRFDRKNATRSKEASFHLPLLAYSTKGYYNLVKLSSLAYLEGFYYRPRIDKEILEKYHEGLIGLSGCLAGEICQNILAGEYEKAEEVALYFANLFGEGNFYIEIQHNGLDVQEKANEYLIKLARKLKLPLVATNDVHYLTKVDSKSHDCLLCLQTNKKRHDEKRFRFPSDEFYLKSDEQMRGEFAHVPEVFDNIQAIVDKVNIELEFNNYHLPKFDTPEGFTDAKYLEKLALEGLEYRYGNIEQVHIERLTKELTIIEDMGFPSYFLIVWDFIKFAHDQGIPVGPGRGSGAGSIIAYAIGITDIDPLKYDLLFERFLNPGRKSMPDFDIDFCQERRQEVIDYVYEKYGRDNVSQIITFGTMGAKGVLRDVGRVLDIPLPIVDKIAKLIPKTLNITLQESLNQEKELRDWCSREPEIQELFQIALSLEGQCRHAGTHAAGVVISDKPIMEYIPLYMSKGDVATQYTMSIVEECGLLKMDFLGLQTLTVIQKAIELIEENHGVKITNETIPLDDKKTFTMMQESNTIGVFQLESSGFREVIGRLKPDRFEDIIALVAMYRPGPLDSGMVDTYIDVKNGKEKAEYDHPILKDILEETYGVILYQEQVMRIANILSGFNLEESDNLRKAMGKKVPKIMAEFRSQFIKGAEANDVSAALAAKTYNYIEKFAGYGFNKSHSAAYAMIAYRTAYLKCNYPEEYMAALMTYDLGNTDKLVFYIEECKRLGFEILPPNINDGEWGFKPSPGKIHFALGAIKGVGKGPVAEIVAQRKIGGEFTSIYDFCERCSQKKVGRACLETMNKGGAFQSINENYALIAATIGEAIDIAVAKQKDIAQGQASLFEDEPEEELDYFNQKDVKEWDQDMILNYEKEYLGLYLSGHPLSKHTDIINKFTTKRLLDLPNWLESLPPPSPDEKVRYRKKPEILIGGMITSIKELTTKKKQEKMAAFIFEDLESSVNCIVFPRQYQLIKQHLQESNIVFIRAEADNSRDEMQLIVNEITPIIDAKVAFSSSLTITKLKQKSFAEKTNKLQQLFLDYKGDCPIYLEIDTPDNMQMTFQVSNKYYVSPTEEFEFKLKNILPDAHLIYQ
ncbi:MAG: DNA polymerase III subunit alpha [Planctomycetota bacterium]|nr:MAG: DNA polymerase III subunit alpha [Planctomycetota bacterium]